jgi:hypothetical protein
MDELEEHQALDRLIAEQEADDTSVVFGESGHENDITIHGLEDRLTTDDEGEAVYLAPRERGTILTGTATWHGTIYGYKRKLCKCARCTAANAKHIADYRAKKKQASDV